MTKNTKNQPVSEDSKIEPPVSDIAAASGESLVESGDAVTEQTPRDTEEEQLLEQFKEQVAQQAEELAAMKDAYVRAKAEQDNVRRRADKEVANGRKFAVEGFAKELLSVRDSLALAATLEVAGDASDVVRSMKDGVDITLKQLDAAFAKFSVVEIDASKGAALDPNIHQAMSIVAVEGVESGCIVDVIQAGFTLHERLLRPAMVVVAK